MSVTPWQAFQKYLAEARLNQPNYLANDNIPTFAALGPVGILKTQKYYPE